MIPVRHIRETVKEPPFSGGFSIRRIETILGGKDMVQEVHRHGFYYVLVLEEGRGEHEIDFVAYPVGGGVVFFMRPGQVHRLVLKAGSKGYLMEFTDTYYSPGYCAFTGGEFEPVLGIITAIYREASGKREKFREVIRALLDIFFIELLRQSRGGAGRVDADKAYRQQRLEELQGLIARHAVEHKQPGWYAEQLHVTLYQVNSVTKELVGKTVSALINDHLLLEAKRYLLATTNQVNQIAMELGYEDDSYFIRFFKKHTGYSPDVFREKFS